VTTRIAHCACRQLQVEADGEPLIVSMCLMKDRKHPWIEFTGAMRRLA
jgi:hypothetical protein